MKGGGNSTRRDADTTRQLDPNRIVNSVSGWADRNIGDVHDYHVYPGPGIPPRGKRALVLGEFGGLGLPLEGHTWQAKDNWGYRTYQDRTSLNTAYLELMQRLRPLIAEGLSAAVYTQTTDVEIEVNGLMTYDRAVLKLDEAAVIEAHRKLHLPPPTVRTVVPNAKTKGDVLWHHTYDGPAKGWEKPTSDARVWPTGPGGFGTEGTPNARIGSKWATPNCYLWRKFDLPDMDFSQLYFDVHHDENCEIYLNGELAAKLTGFTTDYVTVSILPKALATLKRGENVIAVHCRQTLGGQYTVSYTHLTLPTNREV